MKSCLAALIAVLCCHPFGALSQDQATLPSADSVIERVLARASREREEAAEFKRCFSYSRSRTTERRNGKGELLNREVSKEQHVPAPVSRENPVSKTAPGSKPKKARSGSRDVTVDRELLSRFAFAVVGREQIENRATLVLDFTPVGNAPEHNLTDRFINRIAGRVWIDEADGAMARISFHLTSKVNLVAGIAGSIRAFSFDSQRERTGEGLWFTKSNRWHLDTREVVVHRSTDYQEELAEVKRLLTPTAR